MSWSSETRQRLSPEDRSRLHVISAAFDTASDTGTLPELSTLLPPEEPLRSCVLVELIRTELEVRLGRGEPATVAAYVERFTELQHNPDAEFELVEWEYQFAPPSEAACADFCRRYPHLSERLRARFPAPPALPSWCPPGYSILTKLGSGAMGEVWLADQHDPPRRLAIKAISPVWAGHPEAVARFTREATVLKNLNHANVVQILDVGNHAGRQYYTMRYCPSGSLARIMTGNPLPARDVARLVHTLASAVHFVHGNEVVHRDLKPANVLLASNLTTPANTGGEPGLRPDPSLAEFIPLLADFGLAYQQSDHTLTATGQELGTPAYMAPEQAAGLDRDNGPLMDVWALGVMTYQGLTGRLPFPAATSREVLRRIAEDEPVRPRAVIPQLHRDLEAVCLKCLEKKPKRRYPTAKALADDLHRFLNGMPTAARPLGWVGRRGRAYAGLWRKGRRVRTGVAHAVVLTLFAVGAWSAVMWVRQGNAERATAARIAETGRLAGGLLHESDDLQRRNRYKDALDRVRRADALLRGQDAPTLALRDEIGLDRRLTDLVLVDRLTEVRLQQSNLKGENFDTFGADGAYAEAFRAAGIDVDKLSPSDAAARLRSRAVLPRLIGALDDWSMVRQNPAERLHVLAVLAATDDDEWRKQLRAAAARSDRATLRDLAEKADVGAHAPPSLELLGLTLVRLDENPAALAFFRRAQLRHADDILLTHNLARRLENATPPRLEEAAGFYRAVQALFPTSPAVHLNLGACLYTDEEYAAALAAFQEAVRLKPDYVPGLENLGQTYHALNQPVRAVAVYQTALGYEPRRVSLHHNLGIAYGDMRDYAKAVAAFQRALDLDPNHAGARRLLAVTQERMRRAAE